MLPLLDPDVPGCVSTGCHENFLKFWLPVPLLKQESTDGAESGPAIEPHLAP
jgi:hypothetical protein